MSNDFFHLLGGGVRDEAEAAAAAIEGGATAAPTGDGSLVGGLEEECCTGGDARTSRPRFFVWLSDWGKTGADGS